MKTVFATIAIVLLLAPSPARAQACVDLCQALDNGGFEQGLPFWTCSQPNDNYRCPLDPGVVPGGPDGNFVEIENPFDEDVAGKLVHDAQPAAFAAGTCFRVRLLAVRGRYTGGGFPGAPPTAHLAILGWGPGRQPVIDPDEDNWSRRPSAMSCKARFTNWAAPDVWSLPQTFECTAQRDVAFVSLTMAGVNHSRDTYVALDCDTRP
jgi:hypothetical protein